MGPVLCAPIGTVTDLPSKAPRASEASVNEHGKNASCMVPLILFLAATLHSAPAAIAQCANPWHSMAPELSLDERVFASTTWDADGGGPATPLLVVGGLFNMVGSTTVHGVATWNPATSRWSAMGTGFGVANNSVLAFAKLPNGNLVAAGSFTLAGGASANIARWNGFSWSGLGSGTNGTVHALTVLPNGDLVAGGSFTMAGGVAASRVARWNGTAWSPLGSGTNTHVFSLATLPGGDLVAGGDFTVAGGTVASGIARWNGVVWSTLGTGMAGNPSHRVSAMAVLPNGRLVAGGNFDTAGGTSASRIAQWDGSSWSALGSGIAGYIGTIAALTVRPSGELVAGGHFSSAGGVSAHCRDPAAPTRLHGADRRADGECDGVRPRSVSGGGLRPLPHQTDRSPGTAAVAGDDTHRTAAFDLIRSVRRGVCCPANLPPPTRGRPADRRGAPR